MRNQPRREERTCNLEGYPRRLALAERRHPQPLHCFLAVAALEVGGDEALRLLDQLLDALVRVEVRRLHLLHAPFRTSAVIQVLIVLLENLSETWEPIPQRLASLYRAGL